jgi:uncharacterized protein YbcI
MTPDGEPSTAGPSDHGSILAAVSNEMVALFKSQFGRGPTQARANWAGDDILVVILEHTLTPGERNLIDLGEHQRLRDSRTFLQYATVAEFCDPIERLTGRKVRGFLSATDSEVDGMTMETFVLHPPGYEGLSRSDAARRSPHLT